MIILKNLKLKNFLSHSDSEFSFAPNERLLIDGKSGAGKSSIIEAIVWALFNKGRTQNRSLIKHGEKFCQVDLELVDEAKMQTLKIVRRLDTTGKHTVDLLEETHRLGWIPVQVTGTKAIQDYIEKQVIRCSYVLFINSVCYLQENLESFVRQTPANRKDLLLELVHAEDYDVYYEQTKEKINNLNQQLAVNASRKQQLLGELDRNRQYLDNYDQYEKNIQTFEGQLQKTNSELEDIRQQEVELAKVRNNITALKQQLAATDQQIQKVQQMRDELEKSCKELESLDMDKLKIKADRYTEVRNELIVLNGQMEARRKWQQELVKLTNDKPYARSFTSLIEEAREELATLNSRVIEDEECPNCNIKHKCSLLESELMAQKAKALTRLTSLEQEEIEGDKKMADFALRMAEFKKGEPFIDETKLKLLQYEFNDLEPYSKLYQQSQNKEEALSRDKRFIAQYTARLEELTGERKEKLNELSILDASIFSFQSLDERKVWLLKTQEALKVELGSVMELFALAKQAKRREVEIREEMVGFAKTDESLQVRLDNLILLKDAFGQNGIRTIVLDYAIPQLEDRINNILSKLSNFRIRLDTQKANITGEKQIEGLFISILNERNEESDFDSYSGGERLKIIVSISEALSEMQKIGFRILDEVFLALDEESSERFVEVLLAFQERFQQLVCISHLRAVKEVFDHKIQVVNINGNSELAT